MPPRKKIAAVVTEYRRWSHADVIVGKIIEGHNHDGKERPDLELVSLYVDQRPKNDLSAALAKKYGFKISDTIAGAVTLGGKSLAVDGVVCVGEHGTYPTNKRGQILYPRRKFFDEVTKVFAASKKAVPVFSDKHLAATWEDAKWMYDRARELYVPLLAGSSIPVTWRRPDLTIPKGAEVVEAMTLSYGPMEGYGFHALEGLQCMVERRKGGETGVKSVQALKGKAMWEALDKLPHSKELLAAALKRVPAHAPGDMRSLVAKHAEGAVLLIEYRDGLRAAVPMLNGWLYEGDGGGFIFAGKVKDRPAVACQFYLQQPDPFAHFSHLVKAIERLVHTGHAPYPVERTLLTTGMIDAVMTSLHEKGRKIDTPHLAIRYTPTDYPHATGPVPKTIKR